MRIYITLTLLFATAGAIYAQDASPERKQVKGFGFATHLDNWRNVNLDKLVGLLVDAKVEYIRDGIGRGIEKEKGKYVVSPGTYEWVEKVNAKGIKIICVLAYGHPIYENPLDPQAYANYCRFVAKEFKGKINIFEIWNEPANFQFRDQYGGMWNGKGDCPWLKKYAELVEAGSKAIKEVNPDAIVIAGASSPAADLHMISKYPKKLKYIDGLVQHLYPYSLPPEVQPWGGKDCNVRDGIKSADDDHSFDSVIRIIQKAAQKKLGRKLPVWITETGYTSFDNWSKEPQLQAGFTPLIKAAYTTRYVVQALANPYVAATCIYDLKDDMGKLPHEPEANFGVLDYDGNPKPAYKALQRMSGYLAGERKYLRKPPLKAEVIVHKKWKEEKGNKDAWQVSVKEDIVNYVKNNGPVYYWFRINGKIICVFWKAGRYYVELNLPYIQFSSIGHNGYKLVKAVDLVDGEEIPVAPDGKMWKVRLSSNPRIVVFEK